MLITKLILYCFVALLLQLIRWPFTIVGSILYGIGNIFLHLADHLHDYLYFKCYRQTIRPILKELGIYE